MLKPGDCIKGFEILICHICIVDTQTGTILAWEPISQIFVVTDIHDKLSAKVNWSTIQTFDSYTNALAQFNRIVDEEAFLYDSGQI